MEARVVTFPNAQPAVRVSGDRIDIERLALHDGPLAGWLAAQPMDDHAILVERALRIGLTALQSVGVTLNVDAVRAEFDRFADQSRAANEQAAAALEQVLRANFGDDGGRLPRTLEAFLGDRGKLRSMVDELFDPQRRDSAIGRIGSMLERYFDGDGSRLAQLLDPTRLNSPLHQFRMEVDNGFKALHEKLVAIEAAQAARAGERSKSAAKGGDFEDRIEALLGDIARGAGDLIDRTSNDPGATLKSKKGDFVLSLNPGLTRGADVRVVVEAKDRAVSVPAMKAELREARENRGAAVGVVVFTPAHAPAGVAPFDLRGDDVWCVLDPEDADQSTFEVAIRLARYLALASLASRDASVDAVTIGQALSSIREQLDQIRNLKSQLTSIGNATKAVWTGLDTLRNGVAEQVARAEASIRTAGSAG